jgi:hypothetical protein
MFYFLFGRVGMRFVGRTLTLNIEPLDSTERIAEWSGQRGDVDGESRDEDSV